MALAASLQGKGRVKEREGGRWRPCAADGYGYSDGDDGDDGYGDG